MASLLEMLKEVGRLSKVMPDTAVPRILNISVAWMVLGGLAGVSCTGRRGTNMFVFLFVVFLFFLQCSNRMVLGWLAGGQTGGLVQCGGREEVTDFCLCLFCMFLSFSLSYTVARARWVLSF